MKPKDQQNIIVISGPSGAGKGVLIDFLLKKLDVLELAVSATTRKPRVGEVDGKNYYFLSEDMFRKYSKQEKFIEWCSVHGYFYGTLFEEFDRIHNSGNIVLLEVDTKGAEKVSALYPEALTLFIAPPDLMVLKSRLIERNTETEEQIKRRLETAEEEMKKIEDYDYVLFNDKLSDSSATLLALVKERFNV
tara:strand:- start:37 stop:609 length:573 start_codon:yes stop_codon:yes gene_type:complete